MPPRQRQSLREPSGRVQRLAVDDNRVEIMRPVLERRCRERGLRPTADNMRKMQDADAGTIWGKLFMDGGITEAQRDAAEWYSALHADYLKAVYAPKPFAKVASAGGVGGGEPDVPDDWAKAKREEFQAVEGILRRDLTRREISAIKGMCCYDVEHRLSDVLPGLRVIAKIHVDGSGKRRQIVR